MKKLLALLMVLVMAFGTTGALAATDYTNGYTMEMDVNVDKEMASGVLNVMMMGEGVSPEVVSSLLDVVNLACIHVETDTENVNFVANLNEQPMVTMQGTVKEDSVVLVTDVLPSYAFQVNMEGMKMDMAAAQQAEAEFVAALEKVFQDAMASLNATVIAAEPYELAYNEEVTFNYVTVVSVPASQVMTALRDALNQIVDLLDVYMQKTGAQMPEEMNLEELKANLATMPIPEGEQDTPIIISEYVIMEGETAKEGYSYNLVEIADGTDMVYVALAELDKLTDIAVYAGKGEETAEQIYQNAMTGASKAVVLEVAVLEGATDEDMQGSFTMIASGTLIGADVESKAVAEGGCDMTVNLYFFTDQAPMATVNIAMRPLNGEVAAADLTGKTILTPEMLEGENGEAASQALTLELQQSLNTVLVKAVQAAPEQVQALMNAITALQVQPEPTVVE